MKELFDNILSNAFDAMPETGGRIGISAVADKDAVTIVIRDNGPVSPGGARARARSLLYHEGERQRGLGLPCATR